MSKISEYPGHINEDAEFVSADNIEYRVTVTGNCGKFHASVEEWRRCPACSAKTMTMVERVAEAIALAGNGGTWDDWYNEDQKEFHRRRARAAIEAMREPTPSMVKAGTINWDPMDGGPIKPMFDPTKPWQAMIDTALKE